MSEGRLEALIGRGEEAVDAHPEKLFILMSLLAAGVVLLLKDVLLAVYFGFAAFSAVYAVFIMQVIAGWAIASHRSVWASIARHFTVFDMPWVDPRPHERLRIPVWTLGLIGVNVASSYLFFYLLTLPAFRPHFENFLFPIVDATWWNMPLGLFTSIFLHADQMHLWGNMMFLFPFLFAIEQRIGGRQCVALFLATGLAANLLELLTQLLFDARLMPGLGASGAISGVMGFFAVRCYFSQVTFPIPMNHFFGLQLPFGLFLKLRIGSLIVISLYLLFDLKMGMMQIAGVPVRNIGYWCHFWGYAAGILAGFATGMHHAAYRERKLELARNCAEWDEEVRDTGTALKNYQQLLARDPANHEALLAVVRIESKHHATPKGEEAYRQTIATLYRTDRLRAAEAYREYFVAYLKPAPPHMAFEFGKIFARQGDFQLATACFESLLKDAQASSLLKEMALFHLGRLCEQATYADAARHYYQRLVAEYPQSEVREKVATRLLALSGAA